MHRSKLFVIMVSTAVLAAVALGFTAMQDRGVTGELPEVEQGVERISKAVQVDPAEQGETFLVTRPVRELDDMIVLDEDERTVSIPPEGWLAVEFNLPTRQMTVIPPAGSLSDLAWQAIERCPVWLRHDLVDNMRQFYDLTFLPDMWAEAILNCEDPYVDELCYYFAHISPQLYTGGQISWDMDLVLENIEGVYAADTLFDYVSINDYGTSDDDDYYSTTEYLVVNEGDTSLVEIDREIYYMFVMHPRLTDEVPKYINPATGSASPPPDGKFWRDYLLYEPDSGFVSLADQLTDCEIMYGHIQNNNTADNGAVGLITAWIQDVLDFDSGNERPIQPVRIYALHMGRCGEHQDITAAAARAALVPCLGTTSITEDHVWNEFYDGSEWVAWEPVNNYVNSPLAYQGWGKQFPALLDWRSDGWVWTVTDRYHSETAWLDVYVTDTDGRPMDGARVKIMSEYLYGGMQMASSGWTDSDGWYGFPIGTERNIYLSILSEAGSTGNVLVLEADETEPDGTYEYTEEFGDAVEPYEPTDLGDPGAGQDMFVMTLDIDLTDEIAYGQLFSNSDFLASVGNQSGIENRLEAFVCDATNYALFTEGEAFEAWSAPVQVWGDTLGRIVLNAPEEATYYFVISNMNGWRTYQRANVSVLFEADESTVTEQAAQPAAFVLEAAYPNPFNSSVQVRYKLASPQEVKATVYDIQGREVLNRQWQGLATGKQAFTLDMAGAGSGTYFLRLQAGVHTATQKLILVK